MLLLVLGWTVGSFCLPEAPEIKTAKKLKLGMYDFQVKKVMGVDNGLDYSGQNGWGTVWGERRMPMFYFASRIQRLTGLDLFFPSWDSFPVHIHYDKDGHADRIKRGSEIVEAKPAL